MGFLAKLRAWRPNKFVAAIGGIGLIVGFIYKEALRSVVGETGIGIAQFASESVEHVFSSEIEPTTVALLLRDRKQVEEIIKNTKSNLYFVGLTSYHTLQQHGTDLAQMMQRGVDFKLLLYMPKTLTDSSLVNYERILSRYLPASSDSTTTLREQWTYFKSKSSEYPWASGLTKPSLEKVTQSFYDDYPKGWLLVSDFKELEGGKRSSGDVYFFPYLATDSKLSRPGIRMRSGALKEAALDWLSYVIHNSFELNQDDVNFLRNRFGSISIDSL